MMTGGYAAGHHRWAGGNKHALTLVETLELSPWQKWSRFLKIILNDITKSTLLCNRYHHVPWGVIIHLAFLVALCSHAILQNVGENSLVSTYGTSWDNYLYPEYYTQYQEGFLVNEGWGSSTFFITKDTELVG
jgi:hypothetical protein